MSLLTYFFYPVKDHGFSLLSGLIHLCAAAFEGYLLHWLLNWNVIAIVIAVYIVAPHITWVVCYLFTPKVDYKGMLQGKRTFIRGDGTEIRY